MFLGANQDAVEVAETLGVSAANAVTFGEKPEDVSAAFEGVSQCIGAARVSGRADYAALQKAAEKKK